MGKLRKVAPMGEIKGAKADANYTLLLPAAHSGE